jgi:acyl-CoA-binding protein
MRRSVAGKGIRKRAHIGSGHADKPGLLRIVCAFDEETFAQIRGRAVKEQTSFAEQVRRLVEWGLEDAGAA